MSANNYGLTERQAVILTVGFYMLTALVMVSVNKVQETSLSTIRLERTIGQLLRILHL